MTVFWERLLLNMARPWASTVATSRTHISAIVWLSGETTRDFKFLQIKSANFLSKEKLQFNRQVTFRRQTREREMETLNHLCTRETIKEEKKVHALVFNFTIKQIVWLIIRFILDLQLFPCSTCKHSSTADRALTAIDHKFGHVEFWSAAETFKYQIVRTLWHSQPKRTKQKTFFFIAPTHKQTRAGRWLWIQREHYNWQPRSRPSNTLRLMMMIKSVCLF